MSLEGRLARRRARSRTPWGYRPRPSTHGASGMSERGQAGLADRSSRPHQLQTRATDDQRAQGRDPAAHPSAALEDRGLGRLVARHRRPDWKTSRIEPLVRPGPQTRDHPLRNGNPGRNDPYRHQEARPHAKASATASLGTARAKARASRAAIAGNTWHQAVDDNSRLAYFDILPDETRKSCLTFLFNTLRFFCSHGVKVYRVMTGKCVSFRSKRYAKKRSNATHGSATDPEAH